MNSAKETLNAFLGIAFLLQHYQEQTVVHDPIYSMREFLVLELLNRELGLTRKEICRCLGVALSSGDEIINPLIKDGLVRFEDSSRKRGGSLILTKKGYESLPQIRQNKMRNTAEILLNRLSDEEQTTLKTIVDKILQKKDLLLFTNF